MGKAATQVYGRILNAYLDQITPVATEVEYWNRVLNSRTQGGIYYHYLQTAPLRIWAQIQDITRDVKERVSAHRSEQEPVWTARWGQYWNMVSDSIRHYNLTAIQAQIMSPLHRTRLEVRRKQKQLQKLREMGACGLGILENEALRFDVGDGASVSSSADAMQEGDGMDEWKSIIMKSVLLMQTTLRQGLQTDRKMADFEDTVFTEVENGSDEQGEEGLHSPGAMTDMLTAIAKVDLPQYVQFVKRGIKENGRPSFVIRYWIPATVSILASGACMSILLRRKAEVISWLRDLGTTVRDFFYNWVFEPIRKTLATIRHDKDSEIALTSKESLEGDRASLERMVLDFSVDHPASPGHRLNDTEMADLRAKVREGDLTPVLMAYEKDLRRPFLGTVRGDLIRALLIQIQKTKVDVEVAMRGIDNLLKSQELVFAFVGLTPGVLVSIGVARWLAGLAGARGSRSQQAAKTRTVRLLRNTNRILSTARPSAQDTLSFKDHGLLLCEVHMLRQTSARLLPGVVQSEFLEDTNDLVDLNMGITRQQQAIERIWRAYWQWLQ